MDNRAYPRLATDAFCRARFQGGDRVTRTVGIADLSLGGCRIRMPAAAANGLKKRSLLEDWRFSHPALPKDPIQAELVWFRTPAGPEDRYLEVGIRFQDLPAAYASEVRHFLTYVAVPAGPDIDLSGMPA